MVEVAVRATGARTWRASRGVLMVRAAVMATVLLAAMHAIAFAHASLVRSEPAADARETERPRRIRLVFSEPVEAGLAQISIVGADGNVVRLRTRGDPRNVRAIEAPIDDLAPGGWRVSWRVVSADGHPVEGSYVFTFEPSGSADTLPVVPPPPPTTLNAQWGPALAGAPVVPALARGLAVGSLLAAAGLLCFIAIRTSSATADAAMRIATWLSLAAALLLGAHLLAWTANAVPSHSLSLSNLSSASGTTAGRVELVRTALAWLTLWAVALARRPRIALGFACLAVIVGAGAGHAAAIHPVWAIPAKALHLLAIATWLGGLLWLIVLRGDPERIATETRTVSSVALASVVVVGLSGVAQTLLFLPSVAEVVRSGYGLLVLAKVAGFAVLVAFGAHHRFRVLPRLAAHVPDGGFIVTLRREVAVMMIVIMLGGWLAYTPPPASSLSTHPSMIRP